MNNNLSFLFLAIVLGACGQVLLKYAVRSSLGEINLHWLALPATLLKVVSNIWVFLSILLFVSSMLLWIKAIYQLDLSKAYTIHAMSYAIVFVLSVIIFNEPVSYQKIIGLIFVLAGVTFLAR